MTKVQRLLLRSLTVGFKVAQLWRNRLWCELVCFVRWSVLLVLLSGQHTGDWTCDPCDTSDRDVDWAGADPGASDSAGHHLLGMEHGEIGDWRALGRWSKPTVACKQQQSGFQFFSIKKTLGQLFSV